MTQGACVPHLRYKATSCLQEELEEAIGCVLFYSMAVYEFVINCCQLMTLKQLDCEVVHPISQPEGHGNDRQSFNFSL